MYVSVRSLILSLVSVGLLIGASGTAFGGTQMYKGAWIAESFGNDKVGLGGTVGSQYFQMFGIPQGIRCNNGQPLCKFGSTPIASPGGPFDPLGGITSLGAGPFCTPLTVPRPAKGGTVSKGVPPLYRNAGFFTAATPSALPITSSCAASTTISGSYATTYLPPGDPLRGVVHMGAPVSGSGVATTTGNAFKFPAAPVTNAPGAGMFRTTVGSFSNSYPYLYSYTYAALRNDAGNFGTGSGFFSAAATPTTLAIKNKVGATTVASVKVTRGANRFGGVMKLLGSYTTKVCYFYNGGCSLGDGTWQYEHIGAAAYKAGGIVTKAFEATVTFTYYNTGVSSTTTLYGIAQRFPWTTGTVTVTATARGPGKTFEVRKGFDNRVGGVGTVQLVSPLITTWLGPEELETGGVGVLKIQFVPEPGVLAGLLASVSILAVLYRARS